MALSGSQKAYKQARSNIARSGASRSNYVFPLYGFVTINGRDLTKWIQYGTLKITMAINEEPDTCSFDVMLTDSDVDSDVIVGSDVVIGLGGPAENVLFGGRILSTQTTRAQGHVPTTRSVMCADYLQVLDSEYLVTYDWPPQSATVTIKDLIARFTGKHASGVAISVAGVADGLPSHASVGVANERFSTVLRRLVTMFGTGGGFYVDPLKVLHVWQGASEPNVVNPSPLTLASPQLKAFALTEDNSQQRDAVIVEGLRTTAPLGTVWDPATDPAFLLSIPVADASILDKVSDTGSRREVRVGTQRLMVRYADGAWSSPAGTQQTAVVVTDVLFNPGPGIVYITVDQTDFIRGRNKVWVRIDEQYLRVVAASGAGVTPAFLQVERMAGGYGHLIGPIKAGAVVTAIDSLGDIVTTGRYDAPGSLEKIRPQPIDADVVMTVRSSSGAAIHEQIVQDGRYSRTGAGNRGAKEVADFGQALISVQFETDDLNAKPGRLQAYNLADPPVDPMVGQYMILTAELTWPVWGQPPRRTCYATDTHRADVTDAWLVDKR